MHQDAATLTKIMETCTALIFKQILRHGMLPNLKAGKTELLFSIRGKGSQAIKKKLFNVIEPEFVVADAPEGYQRVRLTSKYRHLGTQVHISENQIYEIKARLGQSMTVFRQHRRQIFQNPRIPRARRTFLFQSMILSILQYNIGTWYDLSPAALKYLRSKLYSMYRSLCRATIPEQDLRLWNDERVLAYIALPDVRILLHGARLKYSLSLGKSAPKDLWYILAVEGKWLQALRQSLDWFGAQTRCFGPLKTGAPLVFDFNHSIRSGGALFSRWIKKACHHALLQQRLMSLWKEWHHRFLDLCSQFGLALSFPWTTTGVTSREQVGEACLICARFFPTKAAWSVHAFKRHQRVNDCRFLLGGGTRCEACLREYRTTRRLLHHLMHQKDCASRLRRQGLRYEVGPGRNNTQEDKDTSSFPIPVIRSEGPMRQWAAWIPVAEEVDRNQPPQLERDEDLLGALHDYAMDLIPTEAVEEQLQRCKEVLCTSSSPFTLIRETAFFFFEELETHYEDAGLQINRARLALLAGLFKRRMKLDWFVPASEFDSPWTGQELQENAWRYCQERTSIPPWHAKAYIPRFCSRCLVFVHFFSGVRRQGDLQQYLEEIEIPQGCTRVVLSLDIVFDAKRADLTDPEVQRVWLDYIKRGCVCAIFAGPPCESWSRARKSGGFPGLSCGDGGPRIIRTREQPHGLEALRIREVVQALTANALLLFTMEVFVWMTVLHRLMVIEHPAEPDAADEHWLASIWRLKAMQILERHPSTQLVRLLQGRFGGKSPKPTHLMIVAGDLPVSEILHRFATTSLPAALQMGTCGREFATASLKEYPPLLCQGLADVVEHWCRKYTCEPTIGSPDTMDDFLRFSTCLRQSLNEDAQRGPDFAR